MTHVLWNPQPNGFSLIGEDLVFHRFVQHAVSDRKPLNDGFFVGTIAATFPKKDQTLMMLTCLNERITPKQLQTDWHRYYYSTCEAPPVVDFPALAEKEDIVIVDTRRYPGPQPALAARFELLFDRNGFNVWSRRPGS